jgi:hypothetical protein
MSYKKLRKYGGKKTKLEKVRGDVLKKKKPRNKRIN